MRAIVTGLLLCAAALGQIPGRSDNVANIIPNSTATSVGQLRLWDTRQDHYTGLTAPVTATANTIFRVPSNDYAGCLASDGAFASAGVAANLSFGPCGGANSTTVSAVNPLFLLAHFRDDAQLLYLDYSRDYLNFRPVRKDASYSGQQLRDPTIYWSGSHFWFSSSGVCGSMLWNSPDLINFTTPVNLDFTSFLSGCNRSWGPEWMTTFGTGGVQGLVVSLGTNTTIGPYYCAFNPELGGTTPTACTQLALTGTTSVGIGNLMQVFDPFEYYDPASNEYYLIYVDWNVSQFIAYAKGTTQTGAFVQQTPFSTVGPDHFGFSSAGQTEAPAVVPLVNSTSLYGIAGCVRVYADTWINYFGGGRRYTLQYVDTCPATAGGDPFAVVEPVSGTVNTAGAVVTWTWGPTFAQSSAGQKVTIAGTVYTIQSWQSQTQLTMTTSVGTLTGAAASWVQPTPVNISASEQGTVIAITDQITANIVYRAEDYFRKDFAEQARHEVGSNGAAPFSLTVESKHSTGGFVSYNESATLAAGGPDAAALYGVNGMNSYATWAACGVSPTACPTPNGGEARWVSQYEGFGSAIQMNSTKIDTGETSILMGNGIFAFGNGVGTASSIQNRALWSIGTNNQFYGDCSGGCNTANNAFFVYNGGLGALAAQPYPSNPNHTATNLVVLGDSHMVGLGQTTPIPNQVTDTYGVTLTNLAINSSQFCVSFANPTEEAYIDTLFNPASRANIIVIEGGGNDIDNFISPAAAYDCQRAFARRRRTKGWSIVLYGMYSRGGTGWDNTSLDHLHDELNALYNAGYNTFADAYVNISADPHIGQDTNYTNGTYFQNAAGVGCCNVHIQSSYTSVPAALLTTAVDNVSARGTQAVVPGIGGFPFTVSPWDGSVRAAYGFTLGVGDSSSFASDAWGNFDAYAQGFINIGSGQPGDHYAYVRSGTYSASNGFLIGPSGAEQIALWTAGPGSLNVGTAYGSSNGTISAGYFNATGFFDINNGAVVIWSGGPGLLNFGTSPTLANAIVTAAFFNAGTFFSVAGNAGVGGSLAASCATSSTLVSTPTGSTTITYCTSASMTANVFIGGIRTF